METPQRAVFTTIMEVMNFYPTKAGDVFFIPAGTVHAIGAGNFICEIQQSSNCTYRLYDYDRQDKFGNPRELHLQKALDVLDFKKYTVKEPEREENSDGSMLVRCKYFAVVLYEITDETSISLDNDRFYSVVCIKGRGQLKISDYLMDITEGESVFIPAQKNTLTLTGKISLIVSFI